MPYPLVVCTFPPVEDRAELIFHLLGILSIVVERSLASV